MTAEGVCFESIDGHCGVVYRSGISANEIILLQVYYIARVKRLLKNKSIRGVKGRSLIVLVILGIIIAGGTWVWFIEFGGWDFLLENSRRYPQLRRISSLLDYPDKHYQWKSSMKIFDPLYFGYWYRSNNLKIYDLYISDGDLGKINLHSGLGCDNRIKVPGELISEGENRAVKASYHGYTFNHWSDKKKSWVIELDSGEELNLIVPGDRSYFTESLSSYRAKKFGLLFHENDWIWLKINNEDMGVYYMTGGWNNYWLEKSGKRVNQLVGELGCQIKEGIFPEVWGGVGNWKYYADGTDKKFSNSYYLQKFLDVVNNPNGGDFSQAIGEIMDVDTLIRWKSVSILMNSFHTDNVHNWRMWLNPGTLKFEILPIDRRMTLPTRNLTKSPFIIDGSIDRLSSKIHSSAKLSFAIDQILWEYVRDDNQLEDDLKYWDNLSSRLSSHMYADNKKHFGNISLRTIPLVRAGLINQYKDIRDYLTIEDLRVEVERSDTKTYLVISSRQPTQVELESVIINGRKLEISDKLLFSPQVTTLVDGQYIFDRIFDQLRVPIDCKNDCQVEVTAKNLATGARERVSL